MAYATKFYVTCGRGLVVLERKCNMLCTSGFVDDVMCASVGVGDANHSIIVLSDSAQGDRTGGEI